VDINLGIKMITVDEIKLRIQQGLNTQSVEVEGDGHHFSATIISQDFQGKSRIARHRMVFSLFSEDIKQRLHALSINAMTIDESNNN